jgi:CHAD domain-containing protein
METDYVRLKEIKPVLTGYLSDVQELLAGASKPSDDAIHQIRVALKKARATLKLISPQIDLEYAQKDIISLRDASRLMSTWRDNSVLRKTLRELKKESPVVFEPLGDNERIASILKKPEPSTDTDPAITAEIEKINELFKKTAYRVRFHTMDKLDPQLLLKELEQTYNNVTDVFLKCRNNPKPEKIHEFRKKSKDFMYQLYFFRPLNNDVIKSLGNKLDDMTRNLGKVNDLSQLVKALDYTYPNEANTPALNELVLMIREKQDEYLRKVWPVATKIFTPGRKLVNVLGYKTLVI